MIANAAGPRTVSYRLGFICPLFIMICCCQKHVAVAPAPPASTFLSTIPVVKRSIFPIVCVHRQIQPPGDDVLRSIEGTAFFVGQDGTFATAAHVIRGLTVPNRIAPCEQAAFYLPMQGWNRAYNFRISTFYFSRDDCTVDEQLDIAVCRWPGPGTIQSRVGNAPQPLTVNPTLQDDGTPVAFTGFPLQFVEPLTATAVVAAYRNVPDANTGPHEIVIDKTTWPGASGSPIYLANGEVVGIVLARGAGDAIGIGIGRPARFIQQVLATRR